jgi:RNA polymerase sigma factor (sigma-70 family)
VRVDSLVDALFRREAGRLTARLARSFGAAHIDLVEDVVQETLLRALKNWSVKGVPDCPEAWLATTARNLALDAIRREGALRAKLGLILQSEPPEADDGRDRMALMFACCDPRLPEESQIALTLHMLGGMSSTEIAGSLAAGTNAVEQRVARAKRLLRDQGRPVDLPEPKEIPERTDSVLAVLYQAFAAGYAAHAGPDAVRIDLCADALYLLELVLEDLATDSPSARALHAVFLFFAARIPARTDDWGNVLRLEDQDRTLWDQAIVTKAFREFERSMTGDAVSKYHIEAAILAEHARAPSFAGTDWQAVLSLYRELGDVAPSPSVTLNHAIASGLASGPVAGLAALDSLGSDRRLLNNAPYHAARARFLSGLDDRSPLD